MQSWVEIRGTKSPVGTTGNHPEISKYTAIDNSRSAARIQDQASITFPNRPYGTFPWCMQTPGLRPGLRSAVPTGLDSRHGSSHAVSKAFINRYLYGTVEN